MKGIGRFNGFCLRSVSGLPTCSFRWFLFRKLQQEFYPINLHGSYEIVEHLLAFENGCILFLQSPHNLLSISHFTIEPFHLLVIHIARSFISLITLVPFPKSVRKPDLNAFPSDAQILGKLAEEEDDAVLVEESLGQASAWYIFLNRNGFLSHSLAPCSLTNSHR